MRERDALMLRRGTALKVEDLFVAVVVVVVVVVFVCVVVVVVWGSGGAVWVTMGW